MIGINALDKRKADKKPRHDVLWGVARLSGFPASWIYSLDETRCST